MFQLLIVLAAIGWTSADYTQCNGYQQFSIPTNYTSTDYSWFPYNFNVSQPPMFPNQFSCEYRINVPVGWSVSIRLTVNMTVPADRAVSVSVYDQLNNFEAVYVTNNEHFFFVANGGRIKLDTRDANVRFGFAYKWTKNLNFNDHYSYTVQKSDVQPTALWAFTASPYQIKAETRVSLVVTPPSNDDILQYLRSVIIYDGANWNSTCLGTALQVLNSKQQIVSSGQYMTARLLSPYYGTDRTMLVFQDYENTKDIVQFQGVTCSNIGMPCGKIVMDGSKGKAAVVTVFESSLYGAEYVNGLSGAGVLDVYIGGKSADKSNLIASYDVNNSASSFPQELLGYVRTYVLTGSNAILDLSATYRNFTNSAAVGRKGFFASRYYGTPNYSNQDIYDSVIGDNLYNYVFTIRKADFVGDTTLSVEVTRRGGSSYSQQYNATNLPTVNSTVKYLGHGLTVNYKTYNQKTSGFYMDFEVQKSAANFVLFISLSFTLILQLI